jgi:glutamyl-tRNA synthetase
LRNPDRSKLSKRKNPVWASWYLEQGFLPEAVLNYLSLMGWSHPEQKEIFSYNEFIKEFSLERVQAVGPVFDITKLEWMNGEYIRAMDARKLQFLIYNFYSGKYPEELLGKTLPLVQERIKTLKEYDAYCRFFIEKPKQYDIDLSNYDEMFKHLNSALEKIDKMNWKTERIGEVMQEVAKELVMKNSEFFMVVRVAITGKKITPPLNESMEILGKEECMTRLRTI